MFFLQVNKRAGEIDEQLINRGFSIATDVNGSAMFEPSECYFDRPAEHAESRCGVMTTWRDLGFEAASVKQSQQVFGGVALSARTTTGFSCGQPGVPPTRRENPHSTS